VKFLTSQLLATLIQPEIRQNVRALRMYIAVLAVCVLVFSVLFHLIMAYEGQQHSWLTGVYWTLTVMSTLGFGDITFHSDLGRAFSLLVLLSGIVLLLIVLPFAFIRHFYAPWLEAQLRMRAPRELPEGTRDHVIVCSYTELASELVERLRMQGIAYVVVEPDPSRARTLHGLGITVIRGERDAAETYALARVAAARLLVANADDPTNTNITLTVRERAPDVPIAALAEDKDAIDILVMSGATHVIPLKHRLGEQLVARVRAGQAGAHLVGTFKGLGIAELPARDADLVGTTIKDSRVRERTGLSIVAYWERGRMMPARATARLTEHSVLVLVGTMERLEQLGGILPACAPDERSVLVIGGGRVGRAALRALRRRHLPSVVIDIDAGLRPRLEALADRVVVGDAANIDVMHEAGIDDTGSVLLTTHDDAMNIYVSVYCRQLNPDCRIISRIVHERNLEAIHRAGSDFVLSEVALGIRAILALLHDRELVMAGEQVDVFMVPVPPALAGRTLRESGIGAATGLTVIGIQSGESIVEAPAADTRLERGIELLLLGTTEQREELARWLRHIEARP
jgi:Trk K+ transport system NAD-binding subunit